MRRQRTFAQSEIVDFVIVGSGAAGGVLAKELSTAGFTVIVLEQGPWRRSEDFADHDEFGVFIAGNLTGDAAQNPQTFRATEDEEAVLATRISQPLIYAQTVGGSSVHFTANFWRLHDVDFDEHSRLGAVSGAALADWPIRYDDLEPYYTKVDWEIGVSGVPGPFDPPRSRPYPLPPLPVKSSGVLLERGASALGLHAQPAPMAILSQPYEGRNACGHCGFCLGYGCEFGAKSSTLVTMIPRAVASGNCEVRPSATVFRIEMDASGRATGVLYYDAAGAELRQNARAVIVAANGAETPRLLLMSESAQFPDGLANSSGKVGRYLMWNGQTAALGRFPRALNEHKSVTVTRIIHDFYDSDPARGFYGGGGLDGRMGLGPMLFSLLSMPPDTPAWGAGFKQALHETYTHSMEVACHSTSLPVETNSITLDPVARDRWGRSGIRVTYTDHPDDLAMMTFLQDRGREILEAAGAEKVWAPPVVPQTLTAHLLGTCRMGNDPRESVIDSNHRTHDVQNLFLCDGSSMVTSGRGQPTMTIQALAFRAGDRIGELARRSEI